MISMIKSCFVIKSQKVTSIMKSCFVIKSDFVDKKLLCDKK